MRGMELRAAEPADVPAIRAIYAAYVETSLATFDETAPGDEHFAARLDEAGRAGLPFLVAEEDGAVIAFGHLAPYRPRSAYRFTVEDSVYVAPEARGRGAGRALLGRLLEEAQRAGLRQVVAVVSVTEDPASVALHRAFGFAEAGRLTRVGFKHDTWVDVLFMQRSLER